MRKKLITTKTILLQSGQYQETLQLANVPNGVYYAMLTINGTPATVRKMMRIN